MLNIKKMSVTDTQFFDHSGLPHNKEAGVLEYSANVILDDRLVIQLSGNQNEAHKPSIPTSAECYWNDETAQDWAQENIDIADVMEFLDEAEIENNFGFLEDNATDKIKLFWAKVINKENP